MAYAISISGFKHELITKPFLAIPIRLDFFVMLATLHQKSMETTKKISEFLAFVNVKAITKRIDNIYNFYEIYIALEAIKKEHGLPAWINVTAGPGIAIASLTFFAINNKIPVVSYNDESKATSMINIHNSKNIFIYMNRDIRILELLRVGQKSLEELAHELRVSKSTISRKVSSLKTVSLVETRREKRTMIVSLSSAGSQIMGSLVKDNQQNV